MNVVLFSWRNCAPENPKSFGNFLGCDKTGFP